MTSSRELRMAILDVSSEVDLRPATQTLKLEKSNGSLKDSLLLGAI
jgi:hypothetical protein